MIDKKIPDIYDININICFIRTSVKKNKKKLINKSFEGLSGKEWRHILHMV